MSTGQALGAVAGGAIGFFVGGPTGAMYGAQIGMAAGGYLDPPKGPTQSGPRLSDTSQQTSTYGATIPRVYGTVGVLGNIFWLENNKLKEVVKKKKSGGKGGGSSTTVKTYTYYGTFAVGLCEGPIAGVRRIWVGPDLVYDAGSDDLETIIASNQASIKFTIYLGTADQQPDPRMQAEMGVANCPAYRGLAYVVVKDLLLTKYGNSIMGAQVKVEVVSSSTQLGIRKLSEVEIHGFPIQYTMRPFQDGDSSVFNFYAYDPVAGSTVVDGEYIPNDERLIQISLAGNITRAIAPVVDPLRPQIVSSGAITVQVGVMDGQDVWVPEYFANWVIGAGRQIIPTGSLQNRNTTAVTGSGSDLTVNLITETGRYLQGLAISPDGLRCLIVTSAVPFATTRTADRYFIVDIDATVIESGAVTGDVLDVFMPASTTSAGNGSMCWDGSVGWSACAVGGIELRIARFEIANGQLTSTALVNQAAIGAGYVAAALDSGVFYTSHKSGSTMRWSAYTDYPSLTANEIPLSEIISDESLRSSLLAAVDFDFSALTNNVTGFKVSNIGSIRSAIEPLQGAFSFDVIQSGYKIKAVPRGQSPVAALEIGDLGIEEQLRQAREMDTQLPTKIIANYLDKARNYDANEQFWERPSSGAVNTRTMELPIVMGASQALQVVERLGNLYWLERTEFSPFTLPPPFGYLEAGDVVTLHAGYADYELRLTSVNYQSDGSLACSAKLNNPSLYISQAASDETPDATIIALAGASLYALLDIPVVDETLQNSPGMVGVMTGYTNGWPGGVVYRSPDEGQTWDDIQAFAAKGTLGYARGVLGVHAGNLIDYGSTLTVDLLSGEFSAITEAQMLNGANMVAYGAHGRWEILRFAGATLNADGSRTISTLIRGDRGTEWATGLHVAGDLFVLLDDPDGAWISMPTELIGAPRTYRGVTSGADIDSASSATLTYQGVNLRPLSSVYPVGSRNAMGDLAFSWTRRSRLGSSWWATGVPAPLGETTESYEIDVMSGATVKRTINTTSPATTYTASEQNADFGSAQPAISLRIYQLSSAIGRGLPLEVTL